MSAEGHYVTVDAAEDGSGWPARWYWTGHTYGRPIHPAERLAARNYLARLAGGEGE